MYEWKRSSRVEESFEDLLSLADRKTHRICHFMWWKEPPDFLWWFKNLLVVLVLYMYVVVSVPPEFRPIGTHKSCTVLWCNTSSLVFLSLICSQNCSESWAITFSEVNQQIWPGKCTLGPNGIANTFTACFGAVKKKKKGRIFRLYSTSRMGKLPLVN